MEQKLQTLNQQNKLTLWSERISACRDVSVKLIGGLRDFSEYGIISPYSSG